MVCVDITSISSEPYLTPFRSLIKLLFVTVKIKGTTDNVYIQMHLQSAGETVYLGDLKWVEEAGRPLGVHWKCCRIAADFSKYWDDIFMFISVY